MNQSLFRKLGSQFNSEPTSQKRTDVKLIASATDDRETVIL